MGGRRKPGRKGSECRQVQFVVYGQAEPTQRGRVNRKTGNIYTPTGKGFWKAAVRQRAGQYAVENELTMLTGPLAATIVFFYPRPKSKPHAVWKDTTPDFDNIGKNVCDALEGIIYRNDSQIADPRCPKLYGEPARCVIDIRELPTEVTPADLWEYEAMK